MEELRLATQEIETGCCGNCEGCGKVHVRIFSGHDFPGVWIAAIRFENHVGLGGSGCTHCRSETDRRT